MATLYKTDGTSQQVAPANGTDFKLEELYQLVGNPIDIVRLNNKQLLVVHDEGLVLGLPINPEACRMTGQYIVGDVVRCADTEVK